MIKIALYKGPGDIVDKAIRLWTGSKYSHAELVVDNMWHSSSSRDNGVRVKWIDAKKGNWDYIVIHDIDSEVLELFHEIVGSKYDYLGIGLTQVFPLSIDSKERWFCSEFCAESLLKQGVELFNESSTYSPELLGEALIALGYEFIEG